MSDRDLLERRLLESDVRERRFVEHSLQLAIQAALDAASHVLTDERLGEPATNRELFTLLAGPGWIPDDLRVELERMTGFRNVLVHGYAEVDLDIVRDVVEHRLGDLERFASCLRQRLDG